MQRRHNGRGDDGTLTIITVNTMNVTTTDTLGDRNDCRSGGHGGDASTAPCGGAAGVTDALARSPPDEEFVLRGGIIYKINN